MTYFCCDERRRSAVMAQQVLNGIDFLEVSDDPAEPAANRQRTLFVHFIHPLQPGALSKDNVRIDGGERITGIAVTQADVAAPSSPLIVLAADRSGMEGMYGVSSGIINVVFALGYALGPLLGAASALALPLVVVCLAGAALVLAASLASYRLLPEGT